MKYYLVLILIYSNLVFAQVFDCTFKGSSTVPVRNIEQILYAFRLIDIKSQKELDAYFDKYKRSKELQRDFMMIYREKFAVASRFFGVSYALLTCHAFRESQWMNLSVDDSGATVIAISGSGALGIAQFTEQGAEQVNKLLQVPANRDAWMDYHLYVNDVAVGKTAKEKELLKNHVEEIKEEIGYRFSMDQAFDTTSSIGAKALTFKWIMNTLANDITKMGLGKNVNALDLVLLSALAYNWGPQNVRDRLKEFLSRGHFSETYAQFPDIKNRPGSKNNFESLNHLNSIRNCLKAGNWDPPATMSNVQRRI